MAVRGLVQTLQGKGTVLLLRRWGWNRAALTETPPGIRRAGTGGWAFRDPPEPRQALDVVFGLSLETLSQLLA